MFETQVTDFGLASLRGGSEATRILRVAWLLGFQSLRYCNTTKRRNLKLEEQCLDLVTSLVHRKSRNAK